MWNNAAWLVTNLGQHDFCADELTRHINNYDMSIDFAQSLDRKQVISPSPYFLFPKQQRKYQHHD